jgi:hypothetical protein
VLEEREDNSCAVGRKARDKIRFRKAGKSFESAAAKILCRGRRDRCSFEASGSTANRRGTRGGTKRRGQSSRRQLPQTSYFDADTWMERPFMQT